MTTPAAVYPSTTLYPSPLLYPSAFTGEGLDWGIPVSTGTIELLNPGTAEAWPRLRLDGPLAGGDPPLVSPVIYASTGQRLAYDGTLGHGDWLIIDNHPKRHTVVLNGTTRRRHLLRNPQWISIPAGTITAAGRVTLAFAAASASPSARLTASWSPALA